MSTTGRAQESQNASHLSDDLDHPLPQPELETLASRRLGMDPSEHVKDRVCEGKPKEVAHRDRCPAPGLMDGLAGPGSPPYGEALKEG